MSDEDDWFEQALRDRDEESDSSVNGDSDAETSAADVGGNEAADDENAGPGTGETTGNGNVDTPAETGDERESGGDERESGDESDPFGGMATGGDDPMTSSDPSIVEDGFANEPTEENDVDSSLNDEAFDDEAFDDEAFDDEAFGDGDPMAENADTDSDPSEVDSSDPFGGGSADSFDEDSADPFGGYRDSGPSPPDEFGFGELSDDQDRDGQSGGLGSSGFDVDPDEFESSIERTDIGIEGLDEMILGGVPRRSLLSVIGGAGTGKTTFALQFLYEALESENKGVYITLEQTRESILSTAEEKGWAFREHAEAGRLAIVAIDPIEMANSLASIRNDLTRLIAEFGADRLVLDSVSLLEMMYDHPSKRRSEVFGFTRSLKTAGVTTLLTSEASEKNPYASRHGLVEYLTDAVFVLQYIRGSDFRETRLAVEIQKIRDANHSREMKPYEITDTGISVYGQANIF